MSYYLLVVVDGLTKAAHFIPCSGLPSAEETADPIIDSVFSLYGALYEVSHEVQFTSRS